MAGAVEAKIEELGRSWESFKAANDARLAAIEKKGNADPLLTEKVEKLKAALYEHQKELEELVLKAQRLGPGGGSGETEEDRLKAEHRKAFFGKGGFIRAGKDAKLGELQNALEIGNDPNGGYAVPETLEKRIIEKMQSNAPMRESCNVIQMRNEEYEVLAETGETAYGWVGETEERSETATNKFAQLKPYFGEVYGEPHATQKMLDDAFFDVEAWLATKLERAFRRGENSSFTSGNGIKKPKGILAYTMSESGDSARTFGQVQIVKTGQSGAFKPDKLIDLVTALHRDYRAGAKFMSTTLGLAEVRKLKDTEGRYLWQQSFEAGMPSRLLGYVIEENDDMPDPAADALALMFGDFKRAYTIVDVRGIRMLRDPYTRKPYVKFYTTKRFGGFLEDANAVKVQKLSA